MNKWGRKAHRRRSARPALLARVTASDRPRKMLTATGGLFGAFFSLPENRAVPDMSTHDEPRLSKLLGMR